MSKSFVFLSSILLLVNQCQSNQCSNNPGYLRESGQCAGSASFGSYYLDAWGYKSAAATETSGHSAHCYGYGSCQDSTMDFNSGYRCYGYESCRGAKMSAIYASCTGSLSCAYADITQDANSHPVECSGKQSCAQASIKGTNGVKVRFTGKLAAQGTRIYVEAGQTAYITCGFIARAKDPSQGASRLPEYVFPDCAAATVYKENGATVDCKAIPYMTNYDTSNPTANAGVCPQEVAWNGQYGTPTFQDFIHENEKRFRENPPNDFLEPVDDGLPDSDFPDGNDYEPVINEPNGIIIDFKDPAFIFGVIAVISILVNCCQTYRSFGGFKSGSRRKKVYTGIA